MAEESVFSGMTRAQAQKDPFWNLMEVVIGPGEGESAALVKAAGDDALSCLVKLPKDLMYEVILPCADMVGNDKAPLTIGELIRERFLHDSEELGMIIKHKVAEALERHVTSLAQKC